MRLRLFRAGLEVGAAVGMGLLTVDMLGRLVTNRLPWLKPLCRPHEVTFGLWDWCLGASLRQWASLSRADAQKRPLRDVRALRHTWIPRKPENVQEGP